MSTRPAWFRPARRLPPEAIFLAVVMLLAAWLYSLASAPRSPGAPTSISVAPMCADAKQPCRGRV